MIHDDPKSEVNDTATDPDEEVFGESDLDAAVGQKEKANTTQAPNQQPYNQGEQSISGTTPDPESDDDTLENAHEVGEQLGEDEEHPEEIDIARDIDKAEEDIRTH